MPNRRPTSAWKESSGSKNSSKANPSACSGVSVEAIASVTLRTAATVRVIASSPVASPTMASVSRNTNASAASASVGSSPAMSCSESPSNSGGIWVLPSVKAASKAASSRLAGSSPPAVAAACTGRR